MNKTQIRKEATYIRELLRQIEDAMKQNNTDEIEEIVNEISASASMITDHANN